MEAYKSSWKVLEAYKSSWNVLEASRQFLKLLEASRTIGNPLQAIGNTNLKRCDTQTDRQTHRQTDTQTHVLSCATNKILGRAQALLSTWVHEHVKTHRHRQAWSVSAAGDARQRRLASARGLRGQCGAARHWEAQRLCSALPATAYEAHGKFWKLMKPSETLWKPLGMRRKQKRTVDLKRCDRHTEQNRQTHVLSCAMHNL